MAIKQSSVSAPVAVLAALIGIPLFVFAKPPAPTEPQINAATADDSITCEEAGSRLNTRAYSSPEELLTLQARWLNCETIRLNKAHPDDRSAVILTADKKTKKPFFGVMSVNTAEQVRDLAAILIDIQFGRAVTKDPLTTSITTGFGTYTAEAYYEAGKQNDPLLIVFPTLVPGRKLTVDSLKTLKLDVSDVGAGKFPRHAKQAVGYAKKHPEDVIAPTVTIPVKVGAKAIKKAFHLH